MFELFLILALILLNGVFATSEMALVSARRARLAQAARAGDKGARVALELASSPERFLSTVQIGITLVGILAGSLGGAALAGPLAEVIGKVAVLQPYREELAMLGVVAAITYLSLVLGELVPKRLALGNPEKIAAAMARPMLFLSRLTSPAVSLLEASTSGVVRLLGLKQNAIAAVTVEELRYLVAEGTRAGALAAIHGDLLRNVLSLDDRPAATLMTPRVDVVWLDADLPIAELRARVSASPYSRFPLCRGKLDQVLGVVKARDLLSKPADTPLEEVAIKPLFVAESVDVLALLEAFRHAHTHLALIVDEHGSIEGLITTNDVLEGIAGLLTRANPQQSAEIDSVSRQPDGSLVVDGSCALVDLVDLLASPNGARPEWSGFHTLNGLLMSELGAVPRTGDHIRWQGHDFTVLATLAHLATAVRVTKVT